MKAVDVSTSFKLKLCLHDETNLFKQHPKILFTWSDFFLTFGPKHSILKCMTPNCSMSPGFPLIWQKLSTDLSPKVRACSNSVRQVC